QNQKLSLRSQRRTSTAAEKTVLNPSTSLPSSSPITMYRLHRTLASTTTGAGTKPLHRFFAQLAVAEESISPAINELTTPLTYLDGFPKPAPADTILAIPRAASGKNISAKERKAGRVPGIVFEQENGQQGGNKRLVSVQANRIRNMVDKMGRSFFLSRLFDLEVRSAFEESGEIVEKARVLPRLLHLHSGSDAPLNITFIRAPSEALLKVDVPLVFIGDDVSPGLRKGSYLNVIKRTVKFLCPADIIPPYIEVDLSELDVGEKLLVGDLIVHPALKPVLAKEQPVVKIQGARVSDQKKAK
ncbi:50S ribosomal protein L25, partial [Linum grandiflorum]